MSDYFVVGKPGEQARAPAVVAVRYWKRMDDYQWVVCVHADWSTSLHGFRAKPFLFYAAKVSASRLPLYFILRILLTI